VVLQEAFQAEAVAFRTVGRPSGVAFPDPSAVRLEASPALAVDRLAAAFAGLMGIEDPSYREAAYPAGSAVGMVAACPVGLAAEIVAACPVEVAAETVVAFQACLVQTYLEASPAGRGFAYP